MKVIFLDIDGVLNHENHYKWLYNTDEPTPLQRTHPYSEFNPNSVKELNRILDETNAKLVISSSWRLDGIPVLQNIFKHIGLYHKIFDITSSLTYKYNTTRIVFNYNPFIFIIIYNIIVLNSKGSELLELY